MSIQPVRLHYVMDYCRLYAFQFGGHGLRQDFREQLIGCIARRLRFGAEPFGVLAGLPGRAQKFGGPGSLGELLEHSANPDGRNQGLGVIRTRNVTPMTFLGIRKYSSDRPRQNACGGSSRTSPWKSWKSSGRAESCRMHCRARTT